MPRAMAHFVQDSLTQSILGDGWAAFTLRSSCFEPRMDVNKARTSLPFEVEWAFWSVAVLLDRNVQRTVPGRNSMLDGIV